LAISEPGSLSKAKAFVFLTYPKDATNAKKRTKMLIPNAMFFMLFILQLIADALTKRTIYRRIHSI